MIGKASEIKTKLVTDHWETVEGGRDYYDISRAINKFLSTLPTETEVISIKYHVVTTESDQDQYALIIYKEA